MKCNENTNAISNTNTAAIRIIIICVFLLPIFYGCISLKSEYPDISFYRLTQGPSKFRVGISNEGTLQIRNFSSSDQLGTEHIMAIWDEQKIQNYYYHRWISAPAELVTDFIIERINNSKLFKGGVIKPNSLLIPDYILEGHLLDMIAHNTHDNELDTNYVVISYQISLIKKEPLRAEKNVLLNKLYSISIPRENNQVATIAPAFSRGMSDLSDIMLNDINEAIKNSNKK
ncbi:MAG: hypothetical protein EPN82_15440 [Bacteroidetes bacterium]|nr:MAG: hypothetical protein EPN82_15440 [Bacteroidota bacterium]